MHGGLDCRDVAPGDGPDVVERVTEDIHQDHAAALSHWQLHEVSKTCGDDLAIVDAVDGIGDHVRILIRVNGGEARAAAQKIQRRIVRDAKQPPLRIGGRAGAVVSFERLHERILHHVLAIDHRAGHARAVAVQLGPQIGEKPIEDRARRPRVVGCGVDGWRPVHLYCHPI